MGNQPASLNFALIGHQESWQSVMQFAEAMRLPGNGDNLSLHKVKEIFTFIPPRKIFEIEVSSTLYGKIRGAYIETFIAPDELDFLHLQKNILKVKEACQVCASLEAPIVSLGGFSSIVLENGDISFTQLNNTFFTTGNTLTAAFIAKSVEEACFFWQKNLAASQVLVIGSTGDIGSACVLYFSNKVKKLLLCARNEALLVRQSNELKSKNVAHVVSTNVKELVAIADIIICVASSVIKDSDFDNIPGDAIVCDAGYPKNLQAKYIKNHERLFFGGMGLVTEGYKFDNKLQKSFYQFPIHNVGHGCMLESIVLAMENSPSSYSKGRGNITLNAMENILAMAGKHGIRPAPLFNNVAINLEAVMTA